MKLNTQAVALSFGATAAILWVICYLLVAALPGATMNMTGTMMHTDMGQMSWSMTGGGFITGLIIWTILATAIGWLVSTFYNRFSKPDK